VGYNTNGIRDCKELLEISQQKEIPQTERFPTKHALDAWKHIQCMCESTYIFSVEASQIYSKNRN